MRILRLVVIALFIVALATVANAQATRTWVSGVGDDVNPCSRTAPCKTFAGAISKTAAKGEISVLDPGGYGAVTITKSITIDGQGTLASILFSGTNGVIVNDSLTATPNTIEVVLRNLTMNGGGTGIDGIRFLAGKRLSLDTVHIQNCTGDGIDVDTNAADRIVDIRNSYIENIGQIGIKIEPIGGSVLTSITDTQVYRSTTSSAVFFTGSTKASVSNSTFAACSVGAGVAVSGTADVTLERVQSSNNLHGVFNVSGSPVTRIHNSILTGNGTGATNSSGTMQSFTSNVIPTTSGVVTQVGQN